MDESHASSDLSAENPLYAKIVVATKRKLHAPPTVLLKVGAGVIARPQHGTHLVCFRLSQDLVIRPAQTQKTQQGPEVKSCTSLTRHAARVRVQREDIAPQRAGGKVLARAPPHSLQPTSASHCFPLAQCVAPQPNHRHEVVRARTLSLPVRVFSQVLQRLYALPRLRNA